MQGIEHYQQQIEQVRSTVPTLEKELDTKLPVRLSLGEDRQKLVDEYNMQILVQSETLMETLLKLDSLDVEPEQRPLRKQAVLDSYAILEVLDKLKELSGKLLDDAYLKEILSTLNLEEIMEEISSETQNSVEQAMSEDESTSDDDVIEEKSMSENEDEIIEEKSMSDVESEEEMTIEETLNSEEDEFDEFSEADEYAELYDTLIYHLKKSPIELSIRSKQYQDKYILVCDMTDVDKDSLDLKLEQNDVLSVSGYRLPSREIVYHTIDRLGAVNQDILSHIYRLCRGKFGAFSQKFQLPMNTDKKNISVEEMDNNLVVSIPKVKNPATRKKPMVNPNYNRRSVNPYGRRSAFPYYY